MISSFFLSANAKTVSHSLHQVPMLNHPKPALTSMNAAVPTFALNSLNATTETAVTTASASLATMEMVSIVTVHHNINMKPQLLITVKQLAMIVRKMQRVVKEFACADQDLLETVVTAE